MDKHALKMHVTEANWGDNIFVHEGIGHNRYGIFNRKSRKIIWSSELLDIDERPNSILKASYAKNNFYILDRFHTLHILEGVDSII